MNDSVSRLERSILSGRALHAYLLTGPDPAETEHAARCASSLLLYSYEDIPRLENDPDYMEYGGAISISEFRDVIRPEMYRETYGKRGRAVVFRSASALSEMVQNAMLKVLEEPPENTFFFLTGNEYGILPTIRSRCMTVRCALPETNELVSLLEEKGATHDDARFYAAAGGCVTARALRLASDEDFREMRQGVLKGFLLALNAAPDFKFSKTKREKADLIEANEFLLLAAHDMLNILCGQSADHCTDLTAELKTLCSRFTIREISCIINELTENAERLRTNAPGGASFDRLFARIAEIGLSAKRSANIKKDKPGSIHI